MGFGEKIKDALAARTAEAITTSATVLLAWAAYEVAPVLLPAIEAATQNVLLALLVTSLLLKVRIHVEETQLRVDDAGNLVPC